MRWRLSACTIAAAAALVACGGAGATPGSSEARPSTTNASGTVVDDASGMPLAGVSVKVMPWAPCGPTPSPATSITPENDGCPTPLPSPQATTASNGTFTLNGVQNGRYVLVIGADTVATPPAGFAPSTCNTNACPAQTAAPFAVQATVHDSVMLTGGNQKLVAPTLPQYTSVTYPAWETNGDYRLATLNETSEMPCYIGWEYERAQNNLAGSSVDEWLTENVHAMIAATADVNAVVSQTVSNSAYSGVGYPDCAETLVAGDGFNSGVQATGADFPGVLDPRTMWFAAAYPVLPFPDGLGSAPVGRVEFAIDPRSSGAVWP